jgi:hypothetical protein
MIGTSELDDILLYPALLNLAARLVASDRPGNRMPQQHKGFRR